MKIPQKIEFQIYTLRMAAKDIYLKCTLLRRTYSFDQFVLFFKLKVLFLHKLSAQSDASYITQNYNISKNVLQALPKVLHFHLPLLLKRVQCTPGPDPDLRYRLGGHVQAVF